MPLPLLLFLAGCAHQVAHLDLGEVEVLTLRRSYNNAHLVRLPEGWLLVDAGLERDAPALAAELEAAGVGPGELDLVLLTHGHADHAGGAAWLREAWGVPVLAGAGDDDLLAQGRNDPLCPTDGTARRRLAEAQAETFTPFAPDHRVEAPLDLATLGLRGTVLPVTGHTPGSLVLDLGEAVFVGDLLRGGIAAPVATTHFYQCQPERAVADLAALLERSPADTWFVGHFGPLDRAAVVDFAVQASATHAGEEQP